MKNWFTGFSILIVMGLLSIVITEIIPAGFWHPFIPYVFFLFVVLMLSPLAYVLGAAVTDWRKDEN